MSEEPRFRSIGGVIVPSAFKTTVRRCPDPKCEHAHLVGYDHEGKPFCEIVVSEAHVLEAFRIIEETRK